MSNKQTLLGFFKKLESPRASRDSSRATSRLTPARSPLSATSVNVNGSVKSEARSPITPRHSPAVTTPTRTKSSGSKRKSSRTPSRASKQPRKSTPTASKDKSRLAEDEEEDWEEDYVVSPEEDAESGDEYKPTDAISTSDDDDLSEVDDESMDTASEETDEGSPVKAKKSHGKKGSAKTYRQSDAKGIETTPSHRESGARKVGLEATLEFEHQKLEFIKEPRDLQRRSQSHPDYDPTTLYVPEDYLKTRTPAMRQWWMMKSRHFDTLLLFKVGKFYELYHMDAIEGVALLGLTFMAGDWAHSGFPEAAVHRNMDVLIAKGVRFARVEQTETPAMMEKRCREAKGKISKQDKVVRREICQISSRTLQPCGSEVISGNSYLLALRFGVLSTSGVASEAENGMVWVPQRRTGACLVDTSLARIYVGEFQDDVQLSRLRILLSRFAPEEVMLERNCSNELRSLLKALGATVSTTPRSALSSEKCLALFRDGEFFAKKSAHTEVNGTSTSSAEVGSLLSEYPAGLRCLLDEDDPLLVTPRKGCEFAIAAMADIVYSLQGAMMLEDVLTMGDIQPLSLDHSTMDALSNTLPKVMILDSVALSNLEIIKNSTGSSDLSLLSTIDFCCTRFGQRELKNWLMAPSCIPEIIESRWDAVQDLLDNPELLKNLQDKLRIIPDVDKVLARIHSLSLKRNNHPDSRAIIYSSEAEAKRKMSDFITALDAFQNASRLYDVIKGTHLNSTLLKRLLTPESFGGDFPDIKEIVSSLKELVDPKQALKTGYIAAKPGIDSVFDSAAEQVSHIEKLLDDHLKALIEHFGTKVSYANGNYHVDVPETAAHKADVLEHSQIKCQKKGFARFSTKSADRLSAELSEAKAVRDEASKGLTRSVFETFDQKRSLWTQAMSCLGKVDCLLSLAQYASNAGGPTCRPRIISLDQTSGNKPMLRIKNGCHPCLLRFLGTGKLIPNDFALGTSEKGICDGESVTLLTGPNMGGKSTLIRQVGLLVVLAQLGSFVPAESMEFSLVDRVFTRIGASDNLQLGQSTFLVEMSEVSAALRQATRHSLLLIDELGRGTATNDGASIAFATLKHLAIQSAAEGGGCRVLFSTHFHEIAARLENVFLGHMACNVEGEDNVTFLYKFVKGDCDKSFGFNVARLAGIDAELVAKSRERSDAFARRMTLLKRFANCLRLTKC